MYDFLTNKQQSFFKLVVYSSWCLENLNNMGHEHGIHMIAKNNVGLNSIMVTF
jgi:hypothetical protein